MLLSWRDRLRIFLGPDKIIALRLKKGIGIQCTEKTSLPVTRQDESGWQSSIITLQHYLKSKHENADVTVIVSNHFSRYAILPWAEQIKQPAEEMAYARITFEKNYGELAKKWNLRIANEPYNKPRLISATDSELIETITQSFAGTQLNLTSIQPYLMAAFNQWHTAIKETDYLLLCLENRRLCIAAIQDNKWHQVRTVRVDAEHADTLASLIGRESLMMGLKPETTAYLYAPEHPKFKLAEPGLLKTTYLKLPPYFGFSDSENANYGIVLSGLS